MEAWRRTIDPFFKIQTLGLYVICSYYLAICCVPLLYSVSCFTCTAAYAEGKVHDACMQCHIKGSMLVSASIHCAQFCPFTPYNGVPDKSSSRTSLVRIKRQTGSIALRFNRRFTATRLTSSSIGAPRTLCHPRICPLFFQRGRHVFAGWPESPGVWLQVYDTNMPAGCKVQARHLVSQTTQPKIRFPDEYFWMKWPEEVTVPLWPDREPDRQLRVGQQNATDLERASGDGCRSKIWFYKWNLRSESLLMNKWRPQIFQLNFKARVLSWSFINQTFLFLFCLVLFFLEGVN